MEKNWAYITELCVGGASKLLKHFVRTMPVRDIVSYSNNEYSSGELYQTLGFSLEHDIAVGYYYVHPKEEKLLHRAAFMKHKLVKKFSDKVPDIDGKSGYQIMTELGYLRVWDAGKKRWVLKF